MRALSLVKAHAYGNDFLLAPGVPIADAGRLAGLAREVCDRHHGLGADGLVLVEPTPAGARTRLLNADGSPAEVSGNGVRCVAAWLALERAAPSGATLEIDTAAGVKALTVLGREASRVTFRADMGAPVGLREATLEVAGQSVRAVLLSMGNPQCVVLGPATPERLHALAGPLAVHPHFPEGTNVELATVEAPDRVRILIWERGVGPTSSSGTGTCAAAVAAAAFGGANRTVDVISPGGGQQVEWTDETIWLTGWAEVVATATWSPY